MSLNSAQLVTVAEITQETYGDVETLADGLNDAQVSAIQNDLFTWEDVRDSHVILKGGSDGVDFDNERKREAIRQRVRKALGLPLFSPESPDSLQFVEIDVGANFG